jgi:hypothetical protein
MREDISPLFDKLAAGKAAPFTYHGRVDYVSHQGSQPMSVILRLVDPLVT